MQWSLGGFGRRELVRIQLVGISSRSHPAAVGADGGSAAWGLLIIDSGQCLGQSDGTVVKADKKSFYIVNKSFVIETYSFSCRFSHVH